MTLDVTRWKRGSLYLAILLAAGLLLAACGGGDGGGGGGTPQGSTGSTPDPVDGGTDEPVLVRFGSVGGLTDAGIYIADAFGLFEEQGIRVERIRIASAPDLTAALATGELEVAGISVAPGLFNSVQQGINMRIVGDKQSMAPGISATRLIAQKEYVVEGNVAETLANLVGHDIAVSAKASSVYKLLTDLTEAHGFTIDQFRLVELSYGDMAAAFANGSIQAAVALEPTLTRILQQGATAVVSDLTEYLPEDGITLVPLVYSESFATEQRDVAERFMMAYMQGVRQYNDAFVKGENKDEIVKIIAEYADLDEDLVRSAFMWGLHPNQHVNTDYLAEFQEFFVREGFVPQPIDVSAVVDSSFAEAAVAQLGEY